MSGSDRCSVADSMRSARRASASSTGLTRDGWSRDLSGVEVSPEADCIHLAFQSSVGCARESGNGRGKREGAGDQRTSTVRNQPPSSSEQDIHPPVPGKINPLGVHPVVPLVAGECGKSPGKRVKNPIQVLQLPLQVALNRVPTTTAMLKSTFLTLKTGKYVGEVRFAVVVWLAGHAEDGAENNAVVEEDSIVEAGFRYGGAKGFGCARGSARERRAERVGRVEVEYLQSGRLEV
ncbi:hypothetical protein B0H16DRAFT_1781942 [Mycena metata]|uniref:Uncharacterized protein n=1 Tax=Mycena metata TaxID=1033252 RepID=A0AAD7HPN6_9AGAR|nr:hypothetical protein B0H16DRAFT_1781942 [Mycena metata]